MLLPTLSLILTVTPQSGADTVRADTLRPARLEELVTTAARSSDVASRLPMAIGTVSRRELRQGQPTLGLDEALTTIPGVYVANRWNFSLDQRLSIRGAGSRANFGLRGVKVLLDGVPQTLPDGQSQLTNVEYATLERIEVLKGASSALYGNASGGVLRMESQIPGPGPAEAGVRFEAGSFGSTKWLARTAGRAGAFAGGIAVSRFQTDGFRDQSAADIRQINADLAAAMSPNTRLTFRASFANTPEAQNPGALTTAEAEANPTGAAPANVARGADKQVSQQQVSVALHHDAPSGWSLRGAAFLLWRDLENPLATPPPTGPSATAGTWNAIDRVAGGIRMESTIPLSGPRLRLTIGLDAQQMDDDRVNRRSNGGVPTDSVLADQNEVIGELGPFAQLHWEDGGRWSVNGGLRYDRVAFDITDNHLTDGVDNSGSRTMAAVSGNLGGVYSLSATASVYAQVASAFETPTSTELVSTASGGVGLNPDLGPQRATSLETGVRGGSGGFSFSAAAFGARVSDAIVQARERDGRAYFANAARMRNLGFEAGVGLTPLSGLGLNVAYTFAHYEFDEYRVPNGAAVDTLDGKQLAGVPRHFLRAGVRAGPWRGFTADLDQLISSSLYGDDKNTLEVEGWGAGVTNLRLSWTGRLAGTRLVPFLTIQNVFDRQYIGSVTINGFGGRVLEPSPRRYYYVGLSLGWNEG
jgi:iron complex outermembrane receptor protein